MQLLSSVRIGRVKGKKEEKGEGKARGKGKEKGKGMERRKGTEWREKSRRGSRREEVQIAMLPELAYL